MAENMYVPEDDGENSDEEISVKAELMEQLPHIAMVCHEEREKLHFVVEECLLPLVIRFLGDSDNQMRKTTQAALLVLMEQGLVDMRDVEQQVCPAILMLTEVDNLVEFHTGAVALPYFVELCTDGIWAFL
ncbi:Uncharacterized protein GBIM_20395 [Gryllus bimaculatus]|nr:Uncharacterized protein GBIM_20395 [Gryllus bimaculatus]